MPRTDTNPVEEVFQAALDRVSGRLLEAAGSAPACSALRTHSALGVARISCIVWKAITDDEVGKAVELIRQINDLLEIAPVSARQALRQTRVDLENLVDGAERQRARKYREDASRERKAMQRRDTARTYELLVGENGGAGAAPGLKVEG